MVEFSDEDEAALHHLDVLHEQRAQLVTEAPHIDLVRNDWANEVQVRVGWRDARDPDVDWPVNGSYAFRTEPHLIEECPFAHSEALPMEAVSIHDLVGSIPPGDPADPAPRRVDRRPFLPACVPYRGARHVSRGELDAYLDLIERDRQPDSSEARLAAEIRRLRKALGQQTDAVKGKQNRIRHLERKRDKLGLKLRASVGEVRRLRAVLAAVADHNRGRVVVTSQAASAGSPCCPACFATTALAIPPAPTEEPDPVTDTLASAEWSNDYRGISVKADTDGLVIEAWYDGGYTLGEARLSWEDIDVLRSRSDGSPPLGCDHVLKLITEETRP